MTAQPEPAPAGWEPVRTADGTWTLRAPGHGQACHSRSGAWQESLGFFARPTGLRELARSQERLRLLDIGTGLGLNLAAALAELEGSACRLEVTTLERDERVLRRANELQPNPPGVERWHAPVRSALLADGARDAEGLDLQARGVRARLRLVLGDAARSVRELDPEASFEAVFLDPFSRLVEPDLWGVEFLGEVARRMQPRAVLSTYSNSYTVRLHMARAGLRVGESGPVGDKLRGTVASPEGALPALSERVLERLSEDGVGWA